jgi:2,4-dienoyl-CoA reductase-like NADH-dependent reductase (Old Yellow Enzyme family)
MEVECRRICTASLKEKELNLMFRLVPLPYQKDSCSSNYQVPFAEQIKKKKGILTGAVGLITEAHQAEEIISSGKADLVLFARESLRNLFSFNLLRFK